MLQQSNGSDDNGGKGNDEGCGRSNGNDDVGGNGNDDFCQKCPFSGAQKWDFECPNPKSETTFSRQHPPKMVK